MQKAICRVRSFTQKDLPKTVLIMKFLSFFLLVAGLQVSARGFSQHVTLAEKNISLVKLFSAIEKQTGYSFFYDELFENNVAGIHIGGEWSWGYWLESTNPQHIEIKNCIFRDNRLDMRYAGDKMDMAISIASWTHPDKLGEPSEVLSGLMRNIYIHDNLFEDETICASLQNCADVWFWNNMLKNCKQDLLINEKTAENINRSAPTQ